MVDNTGTLPSLQTVAKALGGEINNGQVLCPGPGHSAADRSLSVKIDSNAPGGFVVHSFSTDDPIACRDYVREKLGLAAFKPNGGGHQRPSDDEIERAVMMAVGAQSYERRGHIIATYNYTDADGKLLHQTLRYEPKGFRQRQPDGNGGWTWKLDDRRVLYRWPDLLKFPDATVFVTEGEKDADNIATLGLCATTVAAGKWTPECVAALAGRDVIILEDNDDAGRKKALAAAHALHGTARQIRVVALPDLPDRGDVSDWLDADPRRAKTFTNVCFDAPLWNSANDKTASPDEPERASSAASTENKPAEKVPLPFVSIIAWQDQPVPERQWTVRDRIPGTNVTLLSGEGAIGKSILALQLSTAVVLGKDWLGSMPKFGPALIVCCEDDADELWRRLDRIAQHYGTTFSELGDMHLLALAGQETVMATPNRHGLIQPTELFKRIHEAACDIKPKLIVLDNAADIYAGDENDRAQVRQFIGILRGLAMSAGAGVLLTSHPSLTGINTGTGLSGSTAWNASVRSRLYFKRATTEKDQEPDPDLRVLEVMKNNYGPVGETIQLRWKDGLFLPVAGTSSLEKLAAEQAANLLFLDLLARFNRQGRNVSDKPTSNGYAPTVFAKETEAKAARISQSAFADAMRRLFAADKIHVETYGRPSRPYSRLVIGGCL